MAPRSFLGLSHTPLLGLNTISPAVEQVLQAALAEMRRQVLASAPELVVLIAPDHYNGFFNELMPPFCIGTQVSAVGDYLSPAGPLRVDEDAALSLCDGLLDAGFDMAISRRMQVDHGFAQPLQLLWGSLDTPPVVPIFLNAVAPPTIPRLGRCTSLGQAIGRHFEKDARRVLFIGSGGLSHEPPVPTLDHADAAVRERITLRQAPTAAERDAKTRRVMAAGRALAEGSPAIKPLNPRWDAAWMDAIAGSDTELEQLGQRSESSIGEEGGLSAHESKSWLIGRAALHAPTAPECLFRHYQAIPEYIAGFGIMHLQERRSC